MHLSPAFLAMFGYDVAAILGVALIVIGLLFRHERRQRIALTEQAVELKLAKHRAEIDSRFRRTLLETLDENVLACDVDGNVLFVNRVASDLAQDEITKVGVEGLTAIIKAYELDGETVIPEDEFPINVARRGKPSGGREVIVETESGERHVRWFSANPIFDPEGGEQIGAIVISSDVTAQHEARNRLANAARFWEMAHEMVCTIDREGFILEADGIWASLGWSPDELIGRSITEMLAADDRSAALALNAQVFDLGPLTDFRQRFQARDGSWHWLNWNAVVDPEQDKLFASARDVTEQVALERKLAAESEKLRQVQSLARTGSFDSDVATGEVTWSDELRGIFGVGPDDPLPTVAEFERLIRAEDVPGVIEGYRIVEEDGRDATFEFRLNRPNKHGDVVHLALRVTAMRDDNGAVVRVFGAAIDISERKTMEQQLQFLAEHDPLTAMPNRRRFGSELESHLSHARRYGSPGAVLMVDLDNLKSVNDELGHQAGDELIRAAAAAMKTRLREHDLLARIGGDEFAVLLPRANRAEARVLAEALLEAIGARSVTLHSTGVTRVTASIGISVLSDLQELTAEAAIAAADTAMYDAKSSGRDRLVVFDHLRHLEFMPHTLGSEPA